MREHTLDSTDEPAEGAGLPPAVAEVLVCTAILAPIVLGGAYIMAGGAGALVFGSLLSLLGVPLAMSRLERAREL